MSSRVVFQRVSLTPLVHRFILADTAELHHKIAQMSSRIRQLEEALEILQDGHPLLSEDMLRIKFGSEVFNAPNRTNEGTALPPTIEESVDALGTLTLNDEGDVKYYGSSGGSEVRIFDTTHGHSWLTYHFLPQTLLMVRRLVPNLRTVYSSLYV